MLGSAVRSVGDVVVLVILFGVTIFVHELGHFLVALRCGLTVDTFSIGFGPALWKKKVRGITCKIGCIPFGGYVTLPQLDPSGMATVQGKPDSGSQDPSSLPAVAPWKKILVSLSGAAGNLVLAVVLAWIVYLSPAPRAEDQGTTVGYVATDSIAYERGLRAGAEIVSVEGRPVGTWQDFGVESVLRAGPSNEVAVTVRDADGIRNVTLPTVENEMGIPVVDGLEKAMLCLVKGVRPGGAADRAGVRPGDLIRVFDGIPVLGTRHFIDLVANRVDEEVDLTVERDGEPVVLRVTPRHDEELGRAVIGVAVDPGIVVMPWMLHKEPMAQIRHDALQIVRILRALVTPREAKRAAEGIGGPVMIISMLWLAIRHSLLNAVGLLRLLNVNLAILNLLPIPVLDGGHVLFSLWEGVTRRRLNPKFVNALINLFMLLLIALLLCLTRMDLLRLFPGTMPFLAPRARQEAAVSTNGPPAQGEEPRGATDGQSDVAE